GPTLFDIGRRLRVPATIEGEVMRRRAALFVMAGAAATVLGAGSLAWACTVIPTVVGANPASGGVGAPVVIEGEGATAGTPVEVRWDSLTGPMLATATPTPEGRF